MRGEPGGDELMYAIVAGGGKVGANITRSLLAMGKEVTLVEQRRDRFEQLEAELGPVVLAGDATELFVLERAGIARPPDLVLAVTGDDEDNIVIAQIAQDGYQVPKVVARVNDPRNQAHFDLLGVTRTLCATSGLLGLVEHEVPEHGLVKLLELRREGLEVVELSVSPEAPAAGKRVAGLSLPDEVRLVSITRNGVAEVAGLETVIRPGDQVIAILKPGLEDRLRKALVG
ncbi:MAG TPA: TrkA family potassium uptake protein [Gaiella sp.]|nr:TrkA family potassium uptake protein [Gaiella sp.]